ncbi:MAG: hypothetical protein IJM85_07585 [Clostridia bacterium]|nr:hypothetical protein [Clostridia bacterium]
MKKEYKELEMSILRFGRNDIITNSGGDNSGGDVDSIDIDDIDEED